jgi:hypothetical protein
MDRNMVLLNRNIAGLRREVRLQFSELERLIGDDVDRTSAAQRLIRVGNDVGSPGGIRSGRNRSDARKLKSDIFSRIFSRAGSRKIISRSHNLIEYWDCPDR